MQLAIGKAADFARLALPDQRGLVAACAEGVAIDAVVAQVGFAADEPLGHGEIPVEHFIPGLEPVQLFGGFGPEGFGVFDGLLVEGFVLLEALDMRLGGELCGRGKDTVFAKGGVEVLAGKSRSGIGRHETSFAAGKDGCAAFEVLPGNERPRGCHFIEPGAWAASEGGAPTGDAGCSIQAEKVMCKQEN